MGRSLDPDPTIGHVGPDPIGHGLGWVRVVFFCVVSSVAHLNQPIWPSINTRHCADLQLLWLI